MEQLETILMKEKVSIEKHHFVGVEKSEEDGSVPANFFTPQKRSQMR